MSSLLSSLRFPLYKIYCVSDEMYKVHKLLFLSIILILKNFGVFDNYIRKFNKGSSKHCIYLGDISYPVKSRFPIYSKLISFFIKTKLCECRLSFSTPQRCPLRSVKSALFQPSPLQHGGVCQCELFAYLESISCFHAKRVFKMVLPLFISFTVCVSTG